MNLVFYFKKTDDAAEVPVFKTRIPAEMVPFVQESMVTECPAKGTVDGLSVLLTMEEEMRLPAEHKKLKEEYPKLLQSVVDEWWHWDEDAFEDLL